MTYWPAQKIQLSTSGLTPPNSSGAVCLSKRRCYCPRCEMPRASAYTRYSDEVSNTVASGFFYCPRCFNEAYERRCTYKSWMKRSFMLQCQIMQVYQIPAVRYAAFSFCGFVFTILLLDSLFLASGKRSASGRTETDVRHN